MILSLPIIGHLCIRDKCFYCSFNAGNLFTHKRQSVMHWVGGESIRTKEGKIMLTIRSGWGSSLYVLRYIEVVFRWLGRVGVLPNSSLLGVEEALSECVKSGWNECVIVWHSYNWVRKPINASDWRKWPSFRPEVRLRGMAKPSPGVRRNVDSVCKYPCSWMTGGLTGVYKDQQL